jgi:hypothetical protein
MLAVNARVLVVKIQEVKQLGFSDGVSVGL